MAASSLAEAMFKEVTSRRYGRRPALRRALVNAASRGVRKPTCGARCWSVLAGPGAAQPRAAHHEHRRPEASRTANLNRRPAEPGAPQSVHRFTVAHRQLRAVVHKTTRSYVKSRGRTLEPF